MSNTPSSFLIRSGSPEDKAELVSSYASAAAFRERAVKMLESKWGKVHGNQISDRAYDSSSWAHKQADANGALRMIEEVLHEVFNVKVKRDAN